MKRKYEESYENCKALAEILNFMWAACLNEKHLDFEISKKDMRIEHRIRDFEDILWKDPIMMGFYIPAMDRAKRNPFRRTLDSLINTFPKLFENLSIWKMYVSLTHTWLFAGINAVNPHKAFQKICELADKFFSKEEKRYIHETILSVPIQNDLCIIDFADEMWNQLKGRKVQTYGWNFKGWGHRKEMREMRKEVIESLTGGKK